MSKRKDILDGRQVKNLMKNYGLIYTCNCGWVDLGHLTPTNSRLIIGATNLWKQISNEGKAVLKSECRRQIFTPAECANDPEYKFPDGKTGYKVRHRQDHAGIIGKPGREGIYIVKHGLSLEQKKSVALAIFMAVSIRFENLQSNFSLFTDSGYSQDDLISNFIGFYIGINVVQRLPILQKCHPVSDKAAYAIWDRDGAVGKNKNNNWTPKLAKDVMSITENACEIECRNQPKKLPAELKQIQPAKKGQNFVEL